jgi:hypothetical protein
MAGQPDPRPRTPWSLLLGIIGGLGAVTVVGVAWATSQGFGPYALLIPGGSVCAGLLVLYAYLRGLPAPLAASDASEPFDDPVIEADRLASGELPPEPSSPVEVAAPVEPSQE